MDMKLAEKNETGVVESVADGTLVIKRMGDSSCHACHLSNVCHYKGQQVITLPDSGAFTQGDIVDIIVRPTQRVFASFMSFILPLLIFFFFYFIFSHVFRLPEIFSILMSFLSIPAWIAVLKILEKTQKTNMEIKIIKRTLVHEDTSE
jgi:positive regulator of sigma E activity